MRMSRTVSIAKSSEWPPDRDGRQSAPKRRPGCRFGQRVGSCRFGALRRALISDEYRTGDAMDAGFPPPVWIHCDVLRWSGRLLEIGMRIGGGVIRESASSYPHMSERGEAPGVPG
jgi:hypothetical protein